MRCDDCGCRLRERVAEAYQRRQYLSLRMIRYCPVHGTREAAKLAFRAKPSMVVKGN